MFLFCKMVKLMLDFYCIFNANPWYIRSFLIRDCRITHSENIPVILSRFSLIKILHNGSNFIIFSKRFQHSFVFFAKIDSYRCEIFLHFIISKFINRPLTFQISICIEFYWYRLIINKFICSLFSMNPDNLSKFLENLCP